MATTRNGPGGTGMIASGQVVGPFELPLGGIYWLRFRLTVPDRPMQVLPKPGRAWTGEDGQPVNAIGGAFAGTTELYWDGRLIWRKRSCRHGPRLGSARCHRRQRADPERTARSR
jgi:hypothetical protein